MRFETVSFTAFYNDMKKYFWKIKDEEIQKAFVAVMKPERKTKYSAGYDFYSPVKMTLSPGQKVSIPSGIKCYFTQDEATKRLLYLYDRSSVGIKFDTQLPNGVGIIDADYYNNPENEGDILIALKNTGYQNFDINVGDRICQGIFGPYYTTSDDHADGERTGGVGSTNKGE